MSPTATLTPNSDRELVLTRLIDAPRAKLYKAWTDPVLLKQWFAPLPYPTPVAELDVRPGGANFMVMRGPDGKDMPMRGVYLEVVENQRGPMHRPARRPGGEALAQIVDWRAPC